MLLETAIQLVRERCTLLNTISPSSFRWLFLTSRRKSIFSLLGLRNSWQNWISIIWPCNTSQTVLHTQILKQTSSRASFLHEWMKQNSRLRLLWQTQLVSRQISTCQIPRQVWSTCLYPHLRKKGLSIYIFYPRPHFFGRELPPRPLLFFTRKLHSLHCWDPN